MQIEYRGPGRHGAAGDRGPILVPSHRYVKNLQRSRVI
jgi:hypothetical protein